VRDAVGASDRLQASVTAAVDDLLDGAAAPPGQVYVGWVAAVEAADCPARYRAHGDEGWGFPGWSAATAAGAIGRAALDHHLDDAGPGAGPGAGRLPAPLEAVRGWMRAAGTPWASGVAGWVGDLRADGDGPALAAVAAAAGRWLAGFVRVQGWPLPSGLVLLNVTREGAPPAQRWWPRKGSPVSVGSGADARVGRVTGSGGYELVVHRPSAGDDRDVHRRATVEAAAGALVHRVAPSAVLVAAGDTGERARIEVDEDLLAAGGDLLVEVVRQRVIALDRGYDAADATPSPRCRWCDLLDECAPGTAWLAGPGRWRGGLPVRGPG
jgi:hypothetical protein